METSAGGFQPTLWSVVLRAKDAGDPHRRTALNRLCETYWRPVYVYLRRKGMSQADGQDATQGFFAEFLEKGLLDRVDRGRGRFKSFLLAVLEHWLANEHRKARAEKRGGGAAPIRLDFAKAESEVRLEPAGGETPEAAFRKSWALAVLQGAFDALRREFEGRGEGSRFEAVRVHLSAAGGRASYQELATRMGLSEADVTNLLHRAKKRLRELIREALRETVDSEDEVDDEQRELFESV